MVEIKGVERDRDIKQLFTQLRQEVHKVVIGNDDVIEEVVIALFAGGHVLLESVPGMGKTLLARTISETLDCGFARVQGTPDLSARDIIGGTFYDEATGQNTVQKGPIFTNILLMDEINRAPPKTQAALLEAMEEKTVSFLGQNYPLPKPFIVLATQNPIDQEGTYQLPEAQMDRFLFKSLVEYPGLDEEMMIARSKLKTEKPEIIFNPAEILIVQKEIKEAVTVPEPVLEYATKIVQATRDRREFVEGAGPRATIALMLTSQVYAFLNGRDFVTVKDVRRLVHPIVRHRVIMYPEFAAMKASVDDIINKILETIDTPM